MISRKQIVPIILMATCGLSAWAQTATSVNISGPMTIIINTNSLNATATITGTGTVAGFGSVNATASGSVSLNAGTCLVISGSSLALGSPGTASASFTLDFGGGNTMTGTLILACSALVTAFNGANSLPSSGSGTGSVAITGGTGIYAGTTGSIPSAQETLTIIGDSESSDGSTVTVNCTAQISGNGTISPPGSGPTATTAPVSATPPSGSAMSQSIQYSFVDPRGASDLDVVNVLINNFLDGRSACYLAYSNSAKVLYLVADDGGTLLGLPLNQSGSVSNSQCSVQGAGTSVTLSGNTLLLTVNLTFTAAFAGNKIQYMAARDLEGNNSGWQVLGVWQVPGFSTFPAAVSVSPARSVGSAETFTFTFSDTSGAQNFGVVNVLINNFLNGISACYIAYSYPLKVLYLVGDAGGGLSAGLTLGGSGSVSNSQCTIDAAGSSATPSDNNLTLVLNITFTAPFDGDRAIYLAAGNASGANSNWQALGSTTIE
jgi:hypothetical protein